MANKRRKSRPKRVFCLLVSSKTWFLREFRFQNRLQREKRLFNKSVVAAHPIRMQVVGGAGFIFTPQLQFGPTLAVSGQIGSPRAAGQNSTGRGNSHEASGMRQPSIAAAVAPSWPLRTSCCCSSIRNSAPPAARQSCTLASPSTAAWSPHPFCASSFLHPVLLERLGRYRRTTQRFAWAMRQCCEHGRPALPNSCPPRLHAISRHIQVAGRIGEPGHQRIVTGELKGRYGGLQPAVHRVRIAFPRILVVERTLIDRDRPDRLLLRAAARIGLISISVRIEFITGRSTRSTG